MAKTRPPYAVEFRPQLVALAQAGRKPVKLARELGRTAQSIRNWVGQSLIDNAAPGASKAGLSTVER